MVGPSNGVYIKKKGEGQVLNPEAPHGNLVKEDLMFNSGTIQKSI